MSSSPLRELREEDADAVAALFAAAFGSERPVDAHEIRSWLRNDDLKPEWLRVLEVDGRIAGYGDIQISSDEVAVDAAAPGHWETFFEWAEDRARSDGIPSVRAHFPEGHEAAGILEARGYRYTGSAFTMEVELEAMPAARPLPAPLELRTYREGDAEAVRNAINDAFARNRWHRDVTTSEFAAMYLASRGWDPDLWLLAWDAGELAGFSLAWPEKSGDAGLGWIGTLGVRDPWRRRGLGAALLNESFRRLYERGLRRVGLGVDAENATGAVHLYERLGMRPVRRSDNWTLSL